MKIEFIENRRQKKRIRKEPGRMSALPKTLLEYRAGRDGFIDMRSAVSVLMPLAREIESKNLEGETLPSLIPEQVAIEERSFTLKPGALEYRGVIYPGFSPPEIYAGATLGVSSDVYSFAAILFFLMTGVEPENAFNRMEDAQPLFSLTLLEEMKTASSIYVKELEVRDDPFAFELSGSDRFPGLSDLVIDDEFTAILERAMALDLEERFQSIGDLMVAFSPYNTKASILYPVMVSVADEDIYQNLLVSKMVPRSVNSKLLKKMEREAAEKAAVTFSGITDAVLSKDADEEKTTEFFDEMNASDILPKNLQFKETTNEESETEKKSDIPEEEYPTEIFSLKPKTTEFRITGNPD